MDNLQNSIRGLLNEKPFYAHFFLNSKVVYDSPQVPRAAVALTKEGVVLFFNKEFLLSLKPKEICAVIEHEVLHILFEHINEMHNEALDKHIANIAMDCAINQHITDLPSFAITLAHVSSLVGQQLEASQTWEYYYSKLLDKKEQLKNASTHDTHGMPSDEKMTPDMQKAVIKRALADAMKASAGNVPEEVLKVYESLKNDSQLPWQQILANFVARCTSSTTQATRKRTNRRFGIEQPGKKKRRDLTLGVCVDSSGSVSEDSYDKFLAEVCRISTMANKIYLIDADCVVQSVETIKKGKKVPLKRSGCGGTAYQPAISKCQELKCDAIVYFGDFDTSDTPADPGIPFLWVGVGTSPKPGNFGMEVRLK